MGRGAIVPLRWWIKYGIGPSVTAGSQSELTARHSRDSNSTDLSTDGWANIGYADGHAKAKRPDSTWTDVNNNDWRTDPTN